MRRLLATLALLACAVAGARASTPAEYASFIDAAYRGGDCATSNFSLTSGCALTQGYWSTHYDGAKEPRDIPWPGIESDDIPGQFFCFDVFRGIAEGLAFPSFYMMDENSYILFSGPNVNEVPFFETPAISPLEAMKKGPGKNGVCFVYARQYIATRLNFCNGACYGYGGINSPVFAAMQTTADFLFGAQCQTAPDGNYNTSDALKAAHQVLDEYNNGVQIFTDDGCVQKYGPYHCEGSDDNTTAEPCRPPVDECPEDPCVGECTYTQGFWKTHSLAARTTKPPRTAKLDAGTLTVGIVPKFTQWNEICDLAWVDSLAGIQCTGVVYSTTTCNNSLENIPYAPWIPLLPWKGILSTPSYGDACFIAAKQVIAADLNIHCGGACSTPAVDSAIADAKAIMLLECSDISTSCAAPPEFIGGNPCGNGPYYNGLGSTVNNPNSTSTANRRRLLSLAQYLDQYNNGFNVGPGHCGDASVTLALEESSSTISTEVLDSDDVSFIRNALIALLVLVSLVVGWKVLATIVYWCSHCVGDKKKKKKDLWKVATAPITKFASASPVVDLYGHAPVHEDQGLRQRPGF